MRFTGKGVILPSSTDLPCHEARGLDSVVVEAMRVNNKQMTQFLQVNNERHQPNAPGGTQHLEENH